MTSTYAIIVDDLGAQDGQSNVYSGHVHWLTDALTGALTPVKQFQVVFARVKAKCCEQLQFRLGPMPTLAIDYHHAPHTSQAVPV